jgi:hypothetical protein
MQFKHPELLYALLLLLIPVIIHLFQLRRFQKIPFTNVQFLKSVTIQTRKSSQLKKWLTLITRLLLLAAIIFAFAQPYFSKSNDINVKAETVIYLDNSFSMQAKGNQGELLQRSVQDIITAIDDTEEVTIFTNDNTFRSVTPKTIKGELLNLEYSSNQLDYNAIILKGKNLFSKETNSSKNLVLLSDFQQRDEAFKIEKDEDVKLNLVQLQPLNPYNVGIDSVYVSKVSATNIELAVRLNSFSDSESEISVSLFNNDNLIAKSAVNIENSDLAIFTLPNNTVINGKVTIEDTNLQFDNSLFFNINEREKINILSINAADDEYLKRVFSEDEFNYTASEHNQLNYNIIESQNLIILNELDNIPVALINSINAFVTNGGYALIIPSNEVSLTSYNQLLNFYGNRFLSLNQSEKKVTTINYSHSIFNAVFDKEITNFQYPKVNSFYTLHSASNSVLQFEDGKPFLSQNGNIFVFTAALITTNTNFTSSPLIVPTIYNIGRQSLQLPKLYYTIGQNNNFDVKTNLQQDDILKLKSTSTEIIPRQRTYNNKISVITNEMPSIAAIYNINNRAETLKRISYNYSRAESNLNYMDLSNLGNVNISSSIPDVFNTIKSDTNVNALWKWFTIFALVLLVIEMLILKYFK